MNVSSYGINFQLDTSLECPHISENGVFLSCKLILPLATAGIMSIKPVQEVLNKCGEQLRGKDKNNSSLNIGNAFQMIATDGISLLGSNSSVPFISSILTGTPLDVIGTTFITFNLRKTQTEAIGNKPLPDSKEMIKSPASKWVMQYVEIMSFSNYGADLSVLKAGINLGDRDRIFGTGTLSHILQKYCVFRLGIKKGEKNSPLKVIEDQQAIQILGMFTNIADRNSNIRYELQNLYNQVLEGINSNNSVITNFSQLTIDFLKNCDTLNNSRQTGIQPSLYEKTLLQFNEIMEYYFEYVFTPYRDKAFAIPDSDIQGNA